MTRDEFEELGRRYREIHEGYVPDTLYSSGAKAKRRGDRLLGDSDGLLSRLHFMGPCLLHSVLTLAFLGLEHLEKPETLWDRQAIDEIKQRVKVRLPQAAYVCIELGRVNRKIYTHIVTHVAPVGARGFKPVRSLGSLARYLCKPPASQEDEMIGMFMFAKREAKEVGKNLPRLSFWFGIRRDALDVSD